MIMNCSECDFRTQTATYESIFVHLLECADDFSPPLYTYVKIEEYAQKILDRAITFEAWKGNDLVGLIAAYFNDNDTKVGFVTNISVLERFRRCGVAFELMQRMIRYGASKGFIRVELEVKIGNSRARRLYERFGFIVIEQAVNTLRMGYPIVVEDFHE